MKSIFNYDGIYGENIPGLSLDYIYYETISARSRVNDWIIKPHIHLKLYQVFILNSGSTTISSTPASQTCSGPCAITIPDGVIHGFTWDPLVDGHIITFNTSFIQKNFPSISNIFSIANEPLISRFEHKEKEFEELMSVAKKIESELFSRSIMRAEMIELLLNQLLLILLRNRELPLSTAAKDTAGNEYYYRFLELMRVGNKKQSLPYYCKKIGVSQTHLNRICNSLVQKSALEIINEYKIETAKMYLIHSPLSVSEISQIIGIDDPAYFSRLFKKVTSISPKNYREKNTPFE